MDVYAPIYRNYFKNAVFIIYCYTTYPANET
jgi:hypothetical protein